MFSLAFAYTYTRCFFSIHQYLYSHRHVLRRRQGLRLPWTAGALLEEVESVAAATACNTSSMRADVARQSPTEIDVITGVVVAEGVRLSVPTPTHAAMLALVRAKEEAVKLPK